MLLILYPRSKLSAAINTLTMILDSKVIMGTLPPAYLPSHSSPSPRLNLSTLPPHILLQIFHSTFPQSSTIPDHDILELQRKTLYWLSTSLRLVNRALYTACMHILRSTYLHAYQALLKPPYTSDPFPVASGPPAYDTDISPTTLTLEESPLQTVQRETLVLDRFITLKVREDVFLDDSSLHIEGDDKFRDLFNLAQPQARLEDLVRICGLREGLITIPNMPQLTRPNTRTPPIYASLTSSSQPSFQPPNSPFHDSNAVTVTYPALNPTPAPIPRFATTSNKPSPPLPRSNGFFSTLRKLTLSSSSSSSSPQSPSPSSPPPLSTPKPRRRIQPLPFSTLSITFTFQSARLIQKKEDGSRRCVAEVSRNRDGRRKETLEVLAEGLIRALKEELEES